MPLRCEHIPSKEAQKVIFQIFRLGVGLFSESIPTSVQKCYGWKVMPSASESFKYPKFNVSGATITCCVSRTLELLTLSEYIPFQAPQLAGCTRVPCYKICATKKVRGRWWVWQEYLFWGQSYFSGPPTTDFFSWTVPHTPSRLPHQSAWHVLHRAFLQKKPQVRPPNRTTKPVRLKESHQISLYHLKISEVFKWCFPSNSRF